jgi:hypothetical protein
MAALLDIVTKGATDRSVTIRIIDDSDGTPETGVVYNTAGIDLWYRREGATKTSLTEADLSTPALDDAHADGGFLHIGNGEYRLDLPDAAFATGASYVDVGGTVTGMVVIGGRVRLVDVDLEDSTRAGLTALPDADADAAGGLPTSDAGGLDLDAKLAATNEVTSARMGALTDLIDGGRLDELIDAIKNKTDGLPASPAAVGSQMTLADGAITAAKIASNAITAVKIADDAITAAKLAADSIGNSQLATSAVTEIQSGLATAAKMLAYVQLLSRKDAAIATDNAVELGEINADGGSGAGTFAGTTDSLEAIRDTDPLGTAMRGTNSAYTGTPPTVGEIRTEMETDGGKLDHLWEMTEDDAGTRRLTTNALEQAPSGSGATAEDVWTYADRTLSAFSFSPTVDVTKIMGVTLSGTAAQVAAGFTYWFDVATPSKTINDAGVAGSGLSQQDVRDAMQLTPTSDDPATGSVDEDLDAIKSKANLIGSVNVTVVSPVNADGDVEIVAGSSYDADEGRALEWSYATTVDHTSATVSLQVMPTSDYNAGTGTWSSLGTGSVAVADGTATVTVELTGEATDDLATSPALDEANYTYHLRVTASGGNTIRDVIGSMTVLRSQDT